MKRENKIKLFSSLFVILIVLMLIFNQALFKIKKFIDISFIPIQSKIYSTTEKAFSIKEIIFSYGDILEENKKLKQENMELKLIKNSNEAILKENERLTSLLEMKETSLNIKNFKFARVIFRDINNINSKFYIDLGKLNGIEKNMIVIYDDFLVGRVAEVFENYSEVSMITESNSRISVRTENGLLGVSQGSDEGKSEMYFQPSTFEEKLELNEEIFTSGISNIYPEGIKVGKIVEINKSENNLFKSIKIEPNFDSKNLKEVMIYKYENNIGEKVN